MPVGQSTLTLLILLDVTVHKAFFHTFSGWLWGALVLCASLSGLLGWAWCAAACSRCATSPR